MSVVRFLLAVPLVLSACSPPPPPDKTDAGSHQTEDVTLAAPPLGQGFQVNTPVFQVTAGQEVQDCYFFQVPGSGTDPVYVKKIEVAQNVGSHHMNVFREKTIARNTDGSSKLSHENGFVVRGLNGAGECFKSANWADWPLIINSQQGGALDWSMPDGVAHKFLPGDWVMLQTHFVNATTQVTDTARGVVYVNFWTTPASAVTSELGTLFATKQSIRVCQSNPTPTFAGTCQFNSPNPLHIVGANAHFHARGKQFTMFTWDGTSTTPNPANQFYQSQAWDDPPMLRSPQLDTVVPANGGVFYNCEYEWTEPPAALGCAGLNAYDALPHPGAPTGTPAADLDCCYAFGGVVEKNEHCNIFVYYYPKVDDINCF